FFNNEIDIAIVGFSIVERGGKVAINESADDPDFPAGILPHQRKRFLENRVFHAGPEYFRKLVGIHALSLPFFDKTIYPRYYAISIRANGISSTFNYF